MNDNDDIEYTDFTDIEYTILPEENILEEDQAVKQHFTAARKFTKLGVKLATGVGTRTIIEAIIESHVEPTQNVFERITRKAGTWGLVGVAVGASKSYADEFIDAAFDSLDGVFAIVEAVKTESDNTDQQS